MPKGLWGRRLVPQPNWVAQLLDPYGHDRTPAENPNRNSQGAFPANGYSPPSYGADIEGAGVPRFALADALAQSEPASDPSMLAEALAGLAQMGMGGPLSNAHDIIPNAPQGPSQQDLDARAARDAIARAQANRGDPLLNPNNDWRWRLGRTNLDRLQERAAADQAELARREGTSFQQFWHFGGRQSPEWQAGEDPYYRLSQLPPEQRDPPPRRGLFANRSRR